MTDLVVGDDLQRAQVRDMARFEQHRVELTGYCYRMLGSPFDADDAVQETLLRAWRNRAQFDGTRATPRTWLYSIATNVCFDLLRGRRRRARAMDLGPASRAGAAIGAPLPEDVWAQPVPDARVLSPTADPAEQAVTRETIRLAFVAALQHLAPRQRAVLILRDVLRWSAAEVADLLDTTAVAVNSALQRARGTLAARDPDPAEPYRPMDAVQQRLLARYVDAFERFDVDALVALLHEDAVTSMPPYLWWLRGREEIRTAFLASDGTCHGSRLIPTAASGSPAFGQYVPHGPGGAHIPWALSVIEVAGGRITAITTHLDADRLFPLFDLPPRLP